MYNMNSTWLSYLLHVHCELLCPNTCMNSTVVAVNFHILAAFCADLLLYLQAIQLYLLPATLQIHYSAWGHT